MRISRRRTPRWRRNSERSPGARERDDKRRGTARWEAWTGSVAVKYAVRCFFFFQAEDGIRDYKVTGVQTCALPIYPFYFRTIAAKNEKVPYRQFAQHLRK